MNEYEKEFVSEVRDKKRTASGVHHKTGKRGYVGTMRTPADLLKGKERREYEGTSEVTVSSVYDTIMPYPEFKALMRHKKMIALHEYRKRFTAKQIAATWGISDKTVYYLYRSYGVPKAHEELTANHTQSEPESARAENAQSPSASQPAKSQRTSQPTVEETPNTAPGETHEKTHGETPVACLFRMNGKYEGKSLARKLEGLAHMTEDGRVYRVTIRIEEQPEEAAAL